MGLDWCVRDKTRPEMAVHIMPREKIVETLNDSMNELWGEFLSQKGANEPHVWPNPLMEEFRKLPKSVELAGHLEDARLSLAECFISGQETLDIPRIGIDKSATKEFNRLWRRHRKQIRADGPPLDGGFTLPTQHVDYWMRPFKELLRENWGKYMVGMVESEGIGSITGMAAAETGFRGKIIGYAESVIGEGLASQAYEDHSPEELVSYGCKLLAASKNYAMISKREWVEDARDTFSASELDKTLGDDDDLWKLFYCFDAAKWCIFWGERGHGMHAWY